MMGKSISIRGVGPTKNTGMWRIKMTEIEKIEGLGQHRVLATLEMFGTIRMAASIMGVSHTALRRWMQTNSIPHPDAKGDGDAPLKHQGKRSSSARLAKWLRKNPNVVLPRSTKKIASLTGCTCDQVKTYLYKRRKAKRALIEKMPDLLKIPALVQDQRGRAIVTAELDSYEWRIDHWSLKAGILGKKGNEGFVIPIPNLDLFYRQVTLLQKALPTTEDEPESSSEIE
jgi:molybdenum-dependent DNA-binding transcriptional regulator ModE